MIVVIVIFMVLMVMLMYNGVLEGFLEIIGVVRVGVGVREGEIVGGGWGFGKRIEDKGVSDISGISKVVNVKREVGLVMLFVNCNFEVVRLN